MVVISRGEEEMLVQSEPILLTVNLKSVFPQFQFPLSVNLVLREFSLQSFADCRFQQIDLTYFPFCENPFKEYPYFSCNYSVVPELLLFFPQFYDCSFLFSVTF